jgi:hypothetical protein
MGYKHRALPAQDVLAYIEEPNFLLKIIPHLDGSARICELVRYYVKDIEMKEAWAGALELRLPALARWLSSRSGKWSPPRKFWPTSHLAPTRSSTTTWRNREE